MLTLERLGFWVDFPNPGGISTARRDLYGVGGWLPEEPPPPRFPIQLI
jgi:hypothetical protein